MQATYLPDQLTPCNAIDVADAFFVAHCKVLRAEPSRRLVAVLTAQSAFETARWQAIHRFNLSNIKAGRDHVGYYTVFGCSERIDGESRWFSPDDPIQPGGPPTAVPPGHPQCRFRAYLSLWQAAEDKLRFLATDTTPHNGRPNRYEAAWAAREDAEAFARELGSAGYYTGPVDAYARGLRLLAAEFEALLAGRHFRSSESEREQLEVDMIACARGEIPEALRRRVELLRGQSMQLGEDFWRNR